MTALSLPANFRPLACELALRKAGLQFTSPINGTMQAIDLVAERWVMALDMPAMGAATGGARAAFLGLWAGGINTVPLHHFGRPQPLGTLRGTPTLGASAARGDNTFALAGCVQDGVLYRNSMEADTNADGLSDGLTSYSAGTVSGVAHTRVGVATGNAQRTAATSIGGTSSDQAGWRLTADVAVAAGVAHTISADIYSSNCSHAIEVVWLSAALSVLSVSKTTWLGDGINYTRRVLTATAPASAAWARVYVYMTIGTGTPDLRVDRLQVETGSTAGTWLPAVTLLQGDMLGVSGHLLQVAADATATEAGTMSVSTVNRARGSISSGTTVAWDRPTATFILPAMQVGLQWQRGGLVGGAALEAVEVY